MDAETSLDNNVNYKLLNEHEQGIAEKIRLFWGCDQFNEFICHLLRESRAAAQRGFPLSIAHSILTLAEEHDRVFPNLAPDGGRGLNLETNSNYLIVKREFPRVAANIMLFWSSPDFSQFIYNLLNDTRDGTRRGFPFDVAKSMVQLALDHDEIFGEAKEAEYDTLVDEIAPSLRSNPLSVRG